MPTTYPTAQYYHPPTNATYYSYQQLRQAFPNLSLPKNMDLPSLDIYQLWYTEPPEAPEGYHVQSDTPTFNTEDSHWYQAYKLVENPAEPAPDPI